MNTEVNGHRDTDVSALLETRETKETFLRGIAKEIVGFGVTLREIEKALVIEAIGNKKKGYITRAARKLGLSRDQVKYRVLKFDL